ncbi:glycosyltransferase family 39 protein, partial [bacterium]|nr:glycosyltransferase family 39 protein [bacterium]
MGNIKKNFIFYALIILSVISVILSWIIYSGHLKYNLINIAIETKLDKQDDIVLKVDDDYFLFKQFDDVLNLTIKKKCKNIELLINKNHKNPIKSIVLFNDVEMNYYTDFSSFEKSSDGDYKKYKFSNEIKFDKNSKMINRNILLDIFSKGVMSFFSGKLVFIFSYILLFVSILYFLNNKNDIKIKFSQKVFFISVLFLAILLRLNNISYYLPWWDEIYSINTTLANADIMKIFQDPGNPWFYYLILKIYNLIFHFDFVGMKILSVIFGIVCNILIYLFLKKYVNLKAANVGFLLSAINIPLIYYSQEIRCYIMQACFVVGFVFLIFNILENNNKKYYILYFILLICAINTHYYQIFLMISNFLFLSFFLLKEKKYKSFLNFSILNFAAILTFLPYFFYCAYNEALLNTSFNTQLPTLSSSLILNIFLYICGGIFSLILFVLYTIKTLKNKEIELKVKNIIIYSFYTFFVVFILALIFSLIIRPMMIQRYFIFLLPLQI